MEKPINKKTYKKKVVNPMSALTLEKNSLKDFISSNKEAIYKEARDNTNYNEEGKPTISRNDDSFSEDIWDDHFKRMDDKNERRRSMGS